MYFEINDPYGAWERLYSELRIILGEKFDAQDEDFDSQRFADALDLLTRYIKDRGNLI